MAVSSSRCSSRTWLRALVPMVAMIALSACSGDPPPTNTGFTGSWGKETSSLEVALYIWNDGQEYRFRMLRESRDKTGRITCNWDGNCEEYVDDRKTSDLKFRLEETDDPSRLLLHCDGQIHHPEVKEIRYTHELHVSDDGLQLLSYTVESQGIRFEEGARGKRFLNKMSDTVPEPPAPRMNDER